MLWFAYRSYLENAFDNDRSCHLLWQMIQSCEDPWKREVTFRKIKGRVKRRKTTPHTRDNQLVMFEMALISFFFNYWRIAERSILLSILFFLNRLYSCPPFLFLWPLFPPHIANTHSSSIPSPSSPTSLLPYSPFPVPHPSPLLLCSPPLSSSL